jgi:hypothetical protein
MWHSHRISPSKELVLVSFTGKFTFNKVLSGRFPFHLSCTFAILPLSNSIWTVDFINT